MLFREMVGVHYENLKSNINSADVTAGYMVTTDIEMLNSSPIPNEKLLSTYSRF
jgi:hypothetical protein